MFTPKKQQNEMILFTMEELVPKHHLEFVLSTQCANTCIKR